MIGRLFLEWAVFLFLELNPIELQNHIRAFLGQGSRQPRSLKVSEVQQLFLFRSTYEPGIDIPYKTYCSYIC